MLLCEQSEGWKRNFYSSHKDLFDRQGWSINHVVNTKLKNSLCLIQEKGRRIPIHIQNKVEKKKLENCLTEIPIEGFDKCKSDCFIALIVIAVKKDNLFS